MAKLSGRKDGLGSIIRNPVPIIVTARWHFRQAEVDAAMVGLVKSGLCTLDEVGFGKARPVLQLHNDDGRLSPHGPICGSCSAGL